MTTHTIDLGKQADEVDDIGVRLERLNNEVVLLTGDSDRTRRQAAKERARVTKELLFLGHQLDRVRVQVLDEYHAIVMGAKAADQ